MVGGRRSPAGREAGFTYFTLVFLVFVLGLASAGAGTLWQASREREKERELLAVGSEIRAAIGRYVAATPRGAPRHPRALEDLVRDPRHPGIVRHLRRVYDDPVTGRPEWGIVRAPDGGIAGVHSLSGARPRKQAGFRAAEARFEGAARYADWQFVFRDRVAEAIGTPARR